MERTLARRTAVPHLSIHWLIALRPAFKNLTEEEDFTVRDGTCTTWPEEFHKDDQQVDGENEEVARGANRTMTASTRKTARYGRIP